MTKQTEQKIVDSALKLFAEKGYKGATTSDIARNAGVSELTIFRKFETKENLFDETLKYSQEKMKKKSFIIFKDLDQKFEDPKDFLEAYIKQLAEFFVDNFDFFNLMVNEDNAKIDLDMGEFTLLIGKFLERNLKNNKIDYKTLGIIINTFMYVITLERYHKRTFYNNNDILEKFRNNLQLCIKSI